MPLKILEYSVAGLPVVSYHSQVLFDPNRLIEIFVLDQPDDHRVRDPDLPPAA